MTPVLPEALEQYCAQHSSGASALAKELAQHTRAQRPDAEMLIGPWEGALLRVLIAVCGARRVLEIGTFTGYSALAMAEALPADGTIVTCDINAETSSTARRFLDRSPHGHKVTIRLGPALETLKTLQPPFDLVFIDADKENYGAYFEAGLALLKSNGVIAVDNVLWSGGVLKPKTPLDRLLADFNDTLRQDPRIECVMLPIRDGVTLIRKRA